MEDFYKRLRCWQTYKLKDYTALEEETDKLLNRNTTSNAALEKKRPTTAIVAGAKNLRAMTS